ncbi:RES family NAD+ phosphorylase [Pseudomonas chengduensis]|uniref:RES family NAD+ phosphorylase n=1 Tax=Pseudomonas sediminis TaxID=1691904 RepID=UPI00244C08E7|nr:MULTISPECIES: RES family NAD+ phosphorylase [Pseudomonas]MDG9757829.1 RES family NAD+ phosphorylase [Pseudomonas sediminis]MDH0622965.1 RES family NAD+ phosphorylase [Pseudomonas chengduensis]MDH1664540.1 RES family NAD+ phosphorylase [Pseudomonas chengduensis]
MPRKKAAPAAGSPPPAADSYLTPEPPATLHITPVTLSRKKVLHRVHSEDYEGDEFNPGLKGNARFSPIRNAEGDPIPTLYAADTFEAALMESVFHDVPHAPGFKQLDKRKLEGQEHSTVQTTQDLKLADLSSKPLRKLGVTRKQLIDTEKDQYTKTREWAEAIHAQDSDIQGLYWVSRQDDSARAVMLFGDRIPEGVLQQVGDARSLLKDEQVYGEVLDLAEVIGVNIVPGKGIK